ncbi:MAG: hypothetical protein KJ886_05335 [Candidatus Thermoplasmatota archaeon]|nr:hypothetical protein [Candidatus Thermoplasmatota archaeon]MBU4256706.1 hypothetical protein [Candidatus Thermoplasmatota archaeon]MCG2826122.1 hypothetical protein [Thermoplasmatales archaeon]
MVKTRCGRILGEDICIEEEDTPTLYFINQLRAYQVVLAALKALDQDVCRDGCSLPSTVNRVIKRLGKLKNDLEALDVAAEKKESLLSKINSFLADAKKLPQDTSQTCRKSAGECLIGSGCFAAEAMNLFKAITEPEALKV